MLHILLSVILVALLFQDKIVTTRTNRDLFVTISILTFGYAIFKNVTVAMLTAAISYVVLSKMSLREKFNTETKKKADGEDSPKTKKVTSAPAVLDSKIDSKPSDKSKASPQATPKPEAEEETAPLPEHCSRIGIRDDVLNGLAKKVDSYQTNVFDKFNYDVFYHEAGSNSMDIQGIFNHEVKGYEA